MATDETVPPKDTEAKAKTKGEPYEGIAFAFCRAATIILIAGKWALPVAAGATAIFYVLAASHGQKETRCIMRVPLLIAAFWGVVCLVSLYRLLQPVPGR